MIQIVKQGLHWRGAVHPPRQWQAEALPRALDAIAAGRSAITHAVMGAGKSALIAEIVSSVTVDEDEVIVVSTPTIALVEQLAAAIEWRLRLPVGRYYTHGRSITGVVVACNPSLLALAADLREHGRRCALWIVDEAHNSECSTIHDAAQALAPYARHGLTATPYRADEEQGLSLWDELTYSYGPAQALRDGVVVPFDVRPWEGGRCSVDDACVEMIKGAIAEGLGPGVVDAGGTDHDTKKPMQGIDDAEAFAARLVAEGVRAAAVHSRMPRADVDARIEDLRTGALQVVVHVTMLKEGVDLPWLRWLCLRRKVGSRVHFAQHVGRVLRAAPGKTRAVIFDPHDLFGVHRLSHAAILGGEPADAPAPDPTEVVLDFLSDLDLGKPRLLEPGSHGEVRVRTELEIYLRRLTVALDTTGIIQRDPESTIPVQGRWRSGRATEAQVNAIRKVAPMLAKARGVPSPVLEALRHVYLYAASGRLSRGAASDLMDIIINVKKRGWSPEASEMLAAGSVSQGKRMRCPSHELVVPRWIARDSGGELLCPRCGHSFKMLDRGAREFLRYPELEGALGASDDGLCAWSKGVAA